MKIFNCFNWLNLTLGMFISIVLTKVHTNTNNETSQNEIKEKIYHWWIRNNDQIRINCIDHKFSIPKIPILEPKLQIRIQSYSCPENTTPSMYLFKNLDKTDYPERKGKLRKISESEWAVWSDKEKKDFNERNICYKMMGLNHKVQEIIGIFTNGTLHGRTKIKWTDNSTVISKFKNGYPHGYQRAWNGDGKLHFAGHYTKGVKIGSYWRTFMDHLIFSSSGIFSREDKNVSLIFPIMTNGSLGDPLAGTFLPHLNILDDVHDVKLTGIESLEGNCMQNVKYAKTQKKDFRYLLRDRSKFSTSFHQSSPLCNTTESSTSDNPDQRLLQFFKNLPKQFCSRWKWVLSC